MGLIRLAVAILAVILGRGDGIRTWAKAHYIAVTDRGRISAGVAEQFEAAAKGA